MLRHFSRSRRSAPLFAEKRPITEKDLWDFVWIGDPQVSPDGSRVAFVRVTVNEKKEGYNTSIWSVPVAGGEAPRQLTKGDHDTTPRWSPDGKFLLFLRSTEKDGKPEPPQLAMLPMAGGDSFVFTDLPRGAGSPVWAPDGKNIAFTSDTNAEDLAKQEKKKARNSQEIRLCQDSGGQAGEQGNANSGEQNGLRARERCARDHARGVSTRQRRLHRSKASDSYLDRDRASAAPKRK